MRIAIDRNSIDAVKDDNEYIYLFSNETLEELLKTNLHCIYYENCSFVDINLTDYNVDCIKKAKITDKDFDYLPPKTDYKIAIIIPNYNYEEWIEKCLKSILNQTYKNYEIIFVDDMSIDNSVAVAKKLLKPPNKVIELKQKRLNGGARNEAYLYLSDDVDYIWYVDSDDWLKDEYVLEKINQRLQMKPDVLFVGWAFYQDGVEATAFIPEYKDRYDAMQGWSGSCGKVIKKELATKQECLYHEGTLKEDKNQHYKICIYMKDFALLKSPIYVWNKTNTKSVTTVRENIAWKTSTIRHYADTLQLYLSVKGNDPRTDALLEKRVRLTKREMESGGDAQW